MRTSSSIGFIVSILASGAFPRSAEALLVEPVRPKDSGYYEKVQWEPRGNVLWVRDCGTLTRDDPRCRDPKVDDPRSLFSRGDAITVDLELSAAKRRGRPYDEVWLYSGGGNSNEGFLVGAVFRRHQVTVRVPPGAKCASACTVAFMGGFFRYIDLEQGAKYLVHSASMWRNGLTADPKAVDAIRHDPASGLLAYARSERIDARLSARRRLRHFQQTLLLPLGRAQEFAESLESIESWAENDPSQLDYDSNQLQRDAARIKSEGDPALQDIVMRIERESMTSAIRDLRSIVGGLGPRAEPALHMIEVMFQTGILETSTLSRETLLQMGFVTKDFVQPPKE